MPKKLVFISLALSVLSLSAALLLGALFLQQTRQQKDALQPTEMTSVDELLPDFPSPALQEGFIDSLVVEPRDEIPYLSWEEDVIITELNISEMEKPIPPPSPPLGIVGVVFVIASDGASLTKPYQIGTLPPGFRVIEGSLTEQFKKTQYQVEVRGTKDGKPVSAITFFSFASSS